MTEVQIQLLALAALLAAIVAVVGYQLAPADPGTAVVPPQRAWR
ncbi:hypothetical protein AB0O22_31830 [Streptomyces sp. NPDC091204]